MKSVLSLSILIAASVVATAQGTSLLDGVLAEETPASMPAPAEESGTKEVPSDETVKTEEQADSADGEDIRTLREEIALLRKDLNRQTSEIRASENVRKLREEVASLRQELDRQPSEVRASENDSPTSPETTGHNHESRKPLHKARRRRLFQL